MPYSEDVNGQAFFFFFSLEQLGSPEAAAPAGRLNEDTVFLPRLASIKASEG